MPGGGWETDVEIRDRKWLGRTWERLKVSGRRSGIREKPVEVTLRSSLPPSALLEAGKRGGIA